MDKTKSCQDCPDRELYCHVICEEYIARKKKREEANKNRHKEECFYYGRVWKKRLTRRKKEGER